VELIHWLALSVSFCATALGQVVYKLFAKSHAMRHLLASGMFFVVAVFTSYFALRQIGVGVVYIGTALTQILVLILSKYVLQEHLSRDHFIAIGLISIGLAAYAVGG